MRKLLESLVGKNIKIYSSDFGYYLDVYREMAYPPNPYEKIIEIGDDLLKIELFDRETNKKYDDNSGYKDFFYVLISSVKRVNFLTEAATKRR